MKESEVVYITNDMIHFIIMNSDYFLQDLRSMEKNEIIQLLKELSYFE